MFDTSAATAVAEPASATIILPDIPELPDVQRLAEEKKVLGFYMSSHPLTRHAAILQALASHQVAELGNVAEKAEVVLGGMIVNLQVKNVQKSRSGLTRMGKLTFEDLSGSVPAMLWPEEFANNEAILKNDLICFVRGKLDRRRDPAELIVSKIIPLERGPAELSRGLLVTLHKASTKPVDVDRLLRTIRAYPGNLDLYLEILGLQNVHRAIYKAGPNLKVRHDDRLLSDLESGFGLDNIRLIGHRGTAGRDESRTRDRVADPLEKQGDDGLAEEGEL